MVFFVLFAQLLLWQGEAFQSVIDAARSADLASAERLLSREHSAESLSALANLALIRRGDVEKSVELLKESRSLNANTVPPLAALSQRDSCGGLGDVLWTAEFALRKLADGGDPFGIHTSLGTVLADSGAMVEARVHFEAAAKLKATPALEFRQVLSIPAVYDSIRHLVQTRKHLEQGVRRLLREDFPALDSLDHLSMPGTFYLVYMGYEDARLMTDLQRAYANAYANLRRNMLPKIGELARRRIGFVSSYFQRHSVCKLFCGLMRELAARGFEVVAYSAAAEPDEWTKWATRGVNVVTIDSGPLLSNRHLVDVDILIFTDIGMETRNLAWAHSRLAPWQILTWGHPHTSGLPDTIDFFVSSDLYDNRYTSYAEQLIRFDSLGFYFRHPREAGYLPHSSSLNSAFFVGDVNITHLYVCPHSLPKFHPHFDYVLVRLLAEAPARMAAIVLVYDTKKTLWMHTIKRRFAGVDNFDRLIFLPLLKGADFFRLLRSATILLDPFPFGGGVTTLEAFSVCRLIVTAPSLQTVPALTAGMYRHANLSDAPIATDADNYVDIVHYLVDHADYRHRLETQLCASHTDPRTSLYSSKDSIDEWERLLDRLLVEQIALA